MTCKKLRWRPKRGKKASRARTTRRIQKHWKSLKRNPTRAERMLVGELNSRKIQHYFQKYFHDRERGYIVDFLFRRERMMPFVVEIDGESHRSKKALWYDTERTRWLKEKRNLRVVRFQNEEVYENVGAVVDKIVSFFPPPARQKEEL